MNLSKYIIEIGHNQKLHRYFLNNFLNTDKAKIHILKHISVQHTKN